MILPVLKYLSKKINDNTPNIPINKSARAGAQETAAANTGCSENNKAPKKAVKFLILKALSN